MSSSRCTYLLVSLHKSSYKCVQTYNVKEKHFFLIQAQKDRFKYFVRISCILVNNIIVFLYIIYYIIILFSRKIE